MLACEIIIRFISYQGVASMFNLFQSTRYDDDFTFPVYFLTKINGETADALPKKKKLGLVYLQSDKRDKWSVQVEEGRDISGLRIYLWKVSSKTCLAWALPMMTMAPVSCNIKQRFDHSSSENNIVLFNEFD